MLKMLHYRKRPVVIEAIQFDQSNGNEICAWANEGLLPSDNAWIMFADETGSRLSIYTREGIMTALYGDWIIKGVAGEFYPCKPDIFAAAYEQVILPHPYTRP